MVLILSVCCLCSTSIPVSLSPSLWSNKITAFEWLWLTSASNELVVSMLSSLLVSLLPSLLLPPLSCCWALLPPLRCLPPPPCRRPLPLGLLLPPLPPPCWRFNPLCCLPPPPPPPPLLWLFDSLVGRDWRSSLLWLIFSLPSCGDSSGN